MNTLRGFTDYLVMVYGRSYTREVPLDRVRPKALAEKFWDNLRYESTCKYGRVIAIVNHFGESVFKIVGENEELE